MSSTGPEDLQEKLARVERALERSERMALASRFAGAIMHEVNNPLEAITNLVYLAKEQRRDPDQVLEYMVTIEKQLQVLGRVTSQALSYHREQAEPKAFDLVSIAQAALKLHADKLARHGVAVERDFRGPAVTDVRANEILQVISNLILNAVDALPRDAGRISIRAGCCSGCVYLAVADNGSGIHPSYANRLFEPYLTSKPAGTGLGLWHSRRLVEKHHGALRFRTSQQAGRQGTTFRINLPTSSV